MSSLSHHGIQGQKWGVRRFQNKDGTRTAAGKKQLKAQRLSRNEKGIRDVYRSLSDEDFRTLGYSKEEADQERKDDFLELGRRHTDYDQYNRVRYKDGKAVGYIAATGYQTTVGRGKKVVNILAVDLAVHSEYRGNGYSVALGKDLVRWFDTYGSKEYDRIEWYAMSENIGSQKAAERSGFTRRSSKEAAKGWVKYQYDKKQKLQHTSIGGTIYIEGNALILGDSSYLEHHGILGQKWGVRRYQNKDGTRKAAGKRRNFEKETSRVINKLSNEPKPIKRRPFDKDKVRQRGLLTKVEADQCAELAAGLYKNAEQVEPKITGDVIRVVSSTSAKMYGLEHRLKQPTSIAAKIGSDAKGDGVSFEEAASGIKDTIRYTAVSDSRDYVDTYNAIKQRLRDNGYEEIKCKNYFQKYQNGEVLHKAVQSTFKSPDGIDFEFQFQTPESQTAKELKLPIYNERRKAGNTPERNAHLEQEMRNLAELVPDPEGVFSIQSHSEVKNIKHTSIGGTMYIEGNALILGDSSYLEHHGVKGQKWGIRRFQNEDGSLTPLGEKRIKKLKKIGDKHNKQQASLYGQSNLYSAKSIQPIFGKFKNLDSETEVLKAGAKINRIATENEPLDDKRKYVSFTSGDNAKYKFFAEVKELGLPKDAEPYAYQFRAIKDIRIANGKAIESFIVNDIKATSTSKKQKEEAKKIIEAFDKHLDNEAIIQGASKVLEKAMSVKEGSDNHFYKEAGIKANAQIDLYRKTIKTYLEGDPKKVEKLADHLRSRGYDAYLDMVDARSSVRWKYGTDYPLIMMSPKDNMELVKSEKLKHTSIGGTMYIEGNALILGDSSYLEHHGIRGQRWGVRRFQNRDGSLTNAGRKRLGYATKGAVQTVGKAFKAGVKAGGNAVKAVKAHHEKKEAEKLQKKKEKASKTRLGVMANKDLFTNEEIRKLNERFKLEDEMKMATLQKGVEIAKAVGTIAQNVGTVAKTYEDVTGQSLSPIKRKAAEEKARQDKEDRERRIAREDADEARKAAKEERDIAIHEQTLRKAIAAADTQEFTAQKTKAEADSSILDAIKKGQDFNGGSDAKTDATGKSWVDKATSDGKNPFDKMIYDRDPDYKEAKDAHDEKVARQERMKYLDERIAAREKEKQAEKEARDQALRDKINQSNEKTGRSKPNQSPQEDKSDDDGGGFAKLKESLPFDKGRYVNRKAAEKARDVKENAEEERTKKQDEKAAKAAIDTIIKDYQHQDDTVRSMNPTKYDREVAASVIKGKAKNALNKVTHPVDTVAKKISDKAREEKWTKERAKLFEEYQDNREKLGTEFANEAYVRAKKQSLQNLGYRGEALDKKLNETPFSKKKKAKHDAFSIQNGVLFVDSSDGLAHHGVKGQRWGVRRFQNPDGSLTDNGRKHYEKALAKEKLKQSDMEEGMYHVENGTLFINAGEPYLEHHGVKGMKWGKHLMAGKGVDAEGGGGGGFAEDDEKLKEMAKKAGMSVAEFRTKMASKLGGAAAKAKKEIGYAYGSEYKKDFEKSARLHENNSRSMREQAKAAWEGYGESRTAAQKDNWKRYAEYDRQAKASGNMFVKRERSKQAYDNSLASKVDSVKRKARLTQDKAKSKISDAVDAAKKTRDDVKDNIRSKTGIGVKKDIERNARLAEGQKRRAHELTKQVYSAKGKEDWARAYAESNKESSKAWDNEHKVKKDTKSYPKSIAGRVDSAKRKARLTKDRLKSALGKSKQRKQLSTEGPKAKKKVRIESASAMGFSTNNPYSIPVDARRWGYNATNKSRVSVGKRGSAPKTILNPKHTDTSHRKKSVGEVMNNAKNPTPGNTPIQSPTQYARANRPRGREKYYKLGQESKGVKKRSRRVRHFDGSDELYTEGTRLVVNSKWG